ncbi:retrovirus-related pol polyprotein from transposon TNT 1-94 [Tanacetum coccineum]
MASQDARLSKFEADFKQQKSKMNNKIDIVLKAITDRITRALPSDTVKNPKLNVHSTSLVLSLVLTQREIPNAHLILLIRSLLSKQPEQTLEDEFKDLHLNLPVLEVLAHAPMYNAILDKYVESLELGKNGSAFIQGEMPKRMEDLRLFTLPYGTKSNPFGIVKDVEVHIGRLKLLNDFYLIDMKKDPKTPLLVGRGFLATANAVIDCRKAKIAIIEGITRSVFRVKGIELGDIPINLKRNMWESEDLIKYPINWDKPPKYRDGAWHAKIKLIDPDGEEFTKTLQSIPTFKKLSERESPREIINLDHFYDT